MLIIKKSVTTKILFLENKMLLKVTNWILKEFRSCERNPTSRITIESIGPYLRWLESQAKIRSRENMVSVLKEIRNCVTRYVAGDPILSSKHRLGLTHRGIPKCLGPLVPIIKDRKPEDLRLVMTLLSLSKLEEGDGTLDVTSIVSPFTGNKQRLDAVTDLCVQKLRDLIRSGKIVPKRPTS